MRDVVLSLMLVNDERCAFATATRYKFLHISNNVYGLRQLLPGRALSEAARTVVAVCSMVTPDFFSRRAR